jgi:hypothetical protein
MEKTRKSLTIFCVILSLAFAGCSNIFEAASVKDSDEALLEDAKKLIDQQSYSDAIAKFASMSQSFKSREDVIEAWAGAYAGKCGLDFISYFGALGSATLTGSSLFKYFMSVWSQKSIDAASCRLAHLKMEEISANPAERSAGQNLFMAILGMVKMGVYLRQYLDKDSTNNLGDGDLDGGIDVCTNDSFNLPGEVLDEVITGLGLLTSNLAYLSAVLTATDINNALDVLNTACSASPGACGKTDAADIVDADRDLFRDLLGTSPTHPTAPLGVGTCVDPLVTPCC